ncbi:MAG: beta-lactamase family protein, partial [Thermomicrobiales bacterium]|nr:beta-lactamase family protein [Thermomicrobiales bacterium]
MNRDRCATGNAHPVDRPLSRRVVLRAAGVAAAPLIAGDLLHSASAAHEATPAPDALPDLSEAAPQILSGERLATFEAYVATKLAELHIPGAAVAVVQGGEVTFLQGFGVREQGQPAPINADTLLRIGSVTKSFSSLLAATLVDAGRVSWETPLVDLLPDFAVADPELTPRLTMADAFCACTGLPRRDWPVVFNSQALTPERVIDGARSLPLTAPYGEQFQYNNQMVAAGGYAAGVADGGSPDALNHAYAIALRSRVLDPIGMPRSTLDLGDVLATGDYAVPHGAEITGALQPMPLQEDDAWILPVEPTGGLWSSAREMARYVQTELQYGVSPDGRRVVSAENLARTWQPVVALAPAAPGTTPALATFGEHYALGWFTGDYFGQRLVWHNGATLGFHSLVTLLPDAELGAVILTNATIGASGAFTTAVQMRLLELLFDLPATIDAALAPGPVAIAGARDKLLAQLGEVDVAAVTPFLGRYTNPDLGQLSLTLSDRALIFDIGSLRSELKPHLGEDGAVLGYLFLDPPLASFPPELTVSLTQDAAGQPQPVLTVVTAPGEAEERYQYEPAG